MLGFLIGIGCTIALFKVARGGRYHRRHHCGGPWRGRGYRRGWRGHHHHHYHGHHHHGPDWDEWAEWHEDGDGPGRGYRGRMGWLMDRLGLTAEQERVIRAELRSLSDQARKFKGALWGSGEGVARAVRADSLDAEVMGEVFASHDDALRDLRKEVVAAMARIHEVLDPRQRERLADWLESGRGPWRGPYRERG